MSLLCFELFSDIVELYWLLCFLFWHSSFLFFFIFGGKFRTWISTFALPISNFRTFSLKTDFYWLPYFSNVGTRLFLDRQFSLNFLMNIVTTRLQQSIIFNLHIINISLLYWKFIYLPFFAALLMFFMHLFCCDIKIVKPFLFSFTPIFYWNIFTYQRFY